MYRRFLNDNDYLSVISPEALSQITRGNAERLAQAEESAEMSVVEHLSENYEIERELYKGKYIAAYDRRISFPVGAYLYYEGQIHEVIRSISGYKAPASVAYWEESSDPNVFAESTPGYSQFKTYRPGDMVAYNGLCYRCLAENGYDCAMQMDADGQHKPEYIAPMLAALEEGNDIVIGSRFLTVKKPKTLRMLGSYIISWSIRLTTGRAICDPTSGMRMFNRAMVEEFAQNLNYGPEPDTISYLIKNGATVKEVQVEMGERLAGQSYLTFWRSVQYMVKMSISILLIQWFRKRDTETPYPERSL